MNRITGRDAFLRAAERRRRHAPVRQSRHDRAADHACALAAPEMGYVLGLQEALVIAMADGYARAWASSSSCNVHVAPGLGNAIGSIYTSPSSGTPMIVTAGQQEQGHGLTEPLLYAPLVPIAQPVVKWAVEVDRIEDLPRIVRRAAKVATTPPTGPVFISLPGDILNNEAAIDLGASTRVDTRSAPRATPRWSSSPGACSQRRTAGDRRRRTRSSRATRFAEAAAASPRRWARRSASRRVGLRRALPVRAPLLRGRAHRATRSRCAACSPSTT